MTSAVYAAINRHRVEAGLSMSAFARLIGVTFDTAFNTLTGRSHSPHDYNAEKFRRYYLAHEAEIALLIQTEKEETV